MQSLHAAAIQRLPKSTEKHPVVSGVVGPAKIGIVVFAANSGAVGFAKNQHIRAHPLDFFPKWPPPGALAVAVVRSPVGIHTVAVHAALKHPVFVHAEHEIPGLNVVIVQIGQSPV